MEWEEQTYRHLQWRQTRMVMEVCAKLRDTEAVVRDRKSITDRGRGS